MPRTKVSKSSKRNREEHCSREMKVREFQELLEKSLNDMERSCLEEIQMTESEFRMLLDRSNSALLKIKMVEFLKLDLAKVNVWDSESVVLPRPSNFLNNNNKNCSTTSIGSLNSRSSNLTAHSMLRKHANDEGYLTEDSGSSSGNNTQAKLIQINNQIQQPLILTQCGRTPGPLSSARARRLRRSRSACDSDRGPNSIKAVLNVSNNIHRSSRSKLRTPTVATRLAVSADRMIRIETSSNANRKSQHSPPAAFMRWPEPGEMVVSTRGSPIVAQVMPPRIANVNIPVKNGILSLRPKRLQELKTDIIEAIDNETLRQIRTLNANLDLIVAMADKANALK